MLQAVMAMENYYESAPEADKKREKAKARELRSTQWWRQKLQAGICYYCDFRFSPDLLTMDHKVPVSRGGKSTKNNVVVCCKECNTQKKHLTPAEIILGQLNEK